MTASCLLPRLDRAQPRQRRLRNARSASHARAPGRACASGACVACAPVGCFPCSAAPRPLRAAKHLTTWPASRRMALGAPRTAHHTRHGTAPTARPSRAPCRRAPGRAGPAWTCVAPNLHPTHPFTFRSTNECTKGASGARTKPLAGSTARGANVRSHPPPPNTNGVHTPPWRFLPLATYALATSTLAHQSMRPGPGPGPGPGHAGALHANARAHTARTACAAVAARRERTRKLTPAPYPRAYPRARANVCVRPQTAAATRTPGGVALKAVPANTTARRWLVNDLGGEEPGTRLSCQPCATLPPCPFPACSTFLPRTPATLSYGHSWIVVLKLRV